MGVGWEDVTWKGLWRAWNPIDGDWGVTADGTGDGAGEGAIKGGGTGGAATWEEGVGVGCMKADIERYSGCVDGCRVEGGGEEIEIAGPDRAGGGKKDGVGSVGGAGERIWVLWELALLLVLSAAFLSPGPAASMSMASDGRGRRCCEGTSSNGSADGERKCGKGLGAQEESLKLSGPEPARKPGTRGWGLG